MLLTDSYEIINSIDFWGTFYIGGSIVMQNLDKLKKRGQKGCSCREWLFICKLYIDLQIICVWLLPSFHRSDSFDLSMQGFYNWGKGWWSTAGAGQKVQLVKSSFVGSQDIVYLYLSALLWQDLQAANASKSFLQLQTECLWRQRSNDCAPPECSCQRGIKGPTVTTARSATLSSFHLIWLDA